MKLTALATALAAFLTSLTGQARADVTHVAVAANFTEAGEGDRGRCSSRKPATRRC